MASFNKALAFAGCGTPPLSRNVDATNAKDGPNLSSKFFDDIVNTLSCSTPENFHAMILCKNILSLGKTTMKLNGIKDKYYMKLLIPLESNLFTYA
jgi:hypothetical protein